MATNGAERPSYSGSDVGRHQRRWSASSGAIVRDTVDIVHQQPGNRAQRASLMAESADDRQKLGEALACQFVITRGWEAA